jgi:hypothetical protein
MTTKKTTPKSTQMRTPEPPEEQQQPRAVEPVQQEEPVRPMAVPEPTIEERMEAIEIRLKVVEGWTGKHQRYHFGKEVSQG